MISHFCRVSHSLKTDNEKREIRRLRLLHSGIRTADRYFGQRRKREISHFLSSSFANKFQELISLHIYKNIHSTGMHPTQKTVFLRYYVSYLISLSSSSSSSSSSAAGSEEEETPIGPGGPVGPGAPKLTYTGST